MKMLSDFTNDQASNLGTSVADKLLDAVNNGSPALLTSDECVFVLSMCVKAAVQDLADEMLDLEDAMAGAPLGPVGKA